MRSLGQFARVEELREMLLEIDIDGEFGFPNLLIHSVKTPKTRFLILNSGFSGGNVILTLLKPKILRLNVKFRTENVN